jgi:hypothetical protein
MTQDVTVSCQPTAEEEEIRREMAAIHDALKPLKVEVTKLEARFIKLWNEKLRLERQRVPIVRVKNITERPTKQISPDELVEKLTKLSPEAQKAILLKLMKGVS